MKGLLSSASSNNTNKLSPQEHIQKRKTKLRRSNNTNKLSPQEQYFLGGRNMNSSNNTNKLSPQEPLSDTSFICYCSNNTNKLSPQEPYKFRRLAMTVQIIQINLVLKNMVLIFVKEF